MKFKELEQKLDQIVTSLEAFHLFESDSIFLPEHITDWKETYRIKRKLVQNPLEKLEKLDASQEILATFRYCKNQETYRWTTLFLAEVIAKETDEAILTEFLRFYGSEGTEDPPSVTDVIHDTFLKREDLPLSPFIQKVNESLDSGAADEAHKILLLLSKIRTDEVFTFLSSLLDKERALESLRAEDFLTYFSNQGRGADLLKNSEIAKTLPEKTKEIVNKLDNENVPQKEEYYQLPTIQPEDKTTQDFLKEVWGFEATIMDDCISCGKETKSHMLPEGEVICHTCWEKGAANEIIKQRIEEERETVKRGWNSRKIKEGILKEFVNVSQHLNYIEPNEELFHAILDTYPEKKIFLQYGESLHELENLKKERELYKKMIEKHPYEPEGYQKLGQLQQKEGDLNEAIPLVAHALELSIKNKRTYPEHTPWKRIEEGIDSLRHVMEARYPETFIEQKTTSTLQEKWLLEEERALFPPAKKQESSLEKFQEKLRRIKSLKRKLQLGELLKENRLNEGIAALKDKNYLTTLENMISQHPIEEVLPSLEKIRGELEEAGIDPFLVQLLADVDTERVVPIQYYFLTYYRTGEELETLFTALSKRKDIAEKFLGLEFSAGRVPIEIISDVWEILKGINEEFAVQSLREYVEKRNIPPYELNKGGWEPLLEALSDTTHQKVEEIFKLLIEKVRGNEGAHKLVQEYHEDWLWQKQSKTP